MTPPAWRLLLELAPRPDLDAAEQLPAGQAEALLGLGLMPPFVDQLQAALSQALSQGPRNGLTVRVWAPAAGAEPDPSAGTDPNWGFFLVEKGADAAGQRAVELYLYHDGR